MDNFVYNALNNYFLVLSKTGYLKHKDTKSLMLLIFYYRLMYEDYRGYITKGDYKLIEKALNCIYGTNCLIPYPDYLKMNKLRLGEMTEVLDRTKALEEYDKELTRKVGKHETVIRDNVRRLDEHGIRLDNQDEHLSHNDYILGKHKERLDLHATEIADHESRITENRGIIDAHSEDIRGINNTLRTHGETLTSHGNRLTAIEGTQVIQRNSYVESIPDIDLPEPNANL